MSGFWVSMEGRGRGGDDFVLIIVMLSSSYLFLWLARLFPTSFLSFFRLLTILFIYFLLVRILLSKKEFLPFFFNSFFGLESRFNCLFINI
jgi:hypothetical protein